MTTFAELRQDKTKLFTMIAAGGAVLIVWVALALPGFRRGTAVALAPSTPAAYYINPVRAQADKLASPAALHAYDAAPSPAGNLTAARGGARAEALPSAAAERKIVRTSSMEIVVQHPAESAEQVRLVAERLGGYLENSQVGGAAETTSASLTIRVPAARFEEARAEIRQLGLRVASEKVDAQDVTMQYVDQQANLRNLHAEEAQYLAILKQAMNVEDALAVSEKLSEVRGQIEQQQSEFNALVKQTEMVAMTLSLQVEPPPQTFGLNWRPVYQLKLALRDGLEGVANYATAMIGVLFLLPSVLLWVGTIAFALFAAWRAINWATKKFARPAPAVQ